MGGLLEYTLDLKTSIEAETTCIKAEIILLNNRPSQMVLFNFFDML